MCRSHHLVNAHEVKPVRLIQSLCAVCGSNLAGLTLLYMWCPAWRLLFPALRGGRWYCMIARFDCNCNKRRLLFIITDCFVRYASSCQLSLKSTITRPIPTSLSVNCIAISQSLTHLFLRLSHTLPLLFRQSITSAFILGLK